MLPSSVPFVHAPGALDMTAMTVFLAIAAIGFIFLLLSLVFGELFDHLDLGGGVDHDLDHGGPGIFSTRILSVFVTCFGAFGAIATQYGMTPAPAAAVGLVGGVVFGGILWGFARFLWAQQASSDVATTDLVGRHGRVVVAIPAGGVGQVRIQLGEQLIDKIARCEDGSAVADNAPVAVESVLGETVVVRRA
jgi:membrane protein implicated in regulation of membrane protease activity